MCQYAYLSRIALLSINLLDIPIMNVISFIFMKVISCNHIFQVYPWKHTFNKCSWHSNNLCYVYECNFLRSCFTNVLWGRATQERGPAIGKNYLKLAKHVEFFIFKKYILLWTYETLVQIKWCWFATSWFPYMYRGIHVETGLSSLLMCINMKSLESM